MYLEQPKGFENKEGKNKVCKLKKVVDKLKQAPKACYERLHSYLIQIAFSSIDNNNIYLKKRTRASLLIAQIFMDDIIFGRDDMMIIEFFEAKKREFKMSMIDEIKFFIGLQVS